MITTTSTNCTAAKWVTFSTRARAYRDYPWFYDFLKLQDWIVLGKFNCSHDPLPDEEDEEAEFDPYFLTEMKLESLGWKSVSIGNYSPYEQHLIRRWVARRRNRPVPLAWVSKSHPVTEICPIIGHVSLTCMCVVCDPSILDELHAYLERFHRPCLIVTKEEITEEIRALLPRNHLILEGSDGTAVSYGLASREAQQALRKLHDRSLLENKEPPLMQSVGTQIGYGTSANYLSTY